MKKILVIATGLLTLMIAPGVASAQQEAPNGYYNNQSQNYRSALSGDDQRKFDQEYQKWVDSERKNDRDDIAEHARKMQDIMVRNNIPANVPFDQLASNPVYPAGYAQPYPNQGYPNQAYPNQAYPNQPYPPQPGAYPTYTQTRLSADDQRKFDEQYAKWVHATQKNDHDDIAQAAGKMQEIMARAGIPSNVPYGAVATNGYLAGPNAPAYGSSAPVGYAQYPVAQRLSADDQKEFDKDYKHWVDARHKRDIDDIDKNARKMQEIMARYNIPANVSYDRIATTGAEYR